MNKNILQFTVIILSIVFIFFLIFNNSMVLESVNFSISVWKDNLFPTLFPFFVVANILIKYGFVEIISPIFSRFMNKLFKLPGVCSFALIISLFSGFPSGAKYTVELLKSNKITNEEANRLITFTHFSNPLFIIGFIGNIILCNNKLALIILISHILGGIITGIIINIKYKAKNYIINKNKKDNTLSLGIVLSDSIFDSLNTMFLLLGIITLFSIITTFISNTLNLSLINKSIISGILEMTQGIKNIGNLNINNYIKVIMITAFISFGGLSVHMQILGIISEYKIKYKSFLIARIIHTIISIGLVSVLYNITY